MNGAVETLLVSRHSGSILCYIVYIVYSALYSILYYTVCHKVKEKHGMIK